jgi:uncharacterized protein
MKLVDANVLLNAVNADAADHASAKRWLDDALSGSARVAFTWPVLIAFVRIATRPAIFARPLTPTEALDIVDAWLGQRAATVIHPTRRHAAALRELLIAVGTAGNLTNDVHLAALAIEHRAEVVTFDADFDRLPGVAWSRPA